MRKKRVSDTTTGAVALFQGARQAAPAAPAGLRADAVDYWHGIIGARAPGEWCAVNLILAEQCALAMAAVAEAQRAIDTEGAFVATTTGSLRAHPAGAVLDSATKRMLSLLRALGLSSVDARDSSQRDGAFRRAKRVANDLDGDDGLLAR